VTVPVIVLAGERPGGNALARALGEPAGILVRVLGEPCVVRVLDALAASRVVRGGVIVGPIAAVAEAEPMRTILAGHDLRWIAPAAGPAESAAAALRAVPGRPLLITSADHALLTPRIIDAFCGLALGVEADFVVGLVPWERVRSAYPSSRRTLLEFTDGTYCGSNLFMVRTPAGEGAVDFWRRMQSHRKRPWRMAREVGLTTLLAYLARRLTLASALARIGELAGCTISHVEVGEPRAAVDVDSLADHALAEEILSTC